MIKKIIVFIQSDGWRNTLRFIANGLFSLLGRESITFCLVGKREALGVKWREYWTKYTCREITSPETIDSMDFPRLKYHPYRQWMQQGAVCRVVFKEGVPVAFGWTHYKEHSIDKVGTFDMGEHIAWLGPYFVHKDFRGQALQQLLIYHDVNEAPKAIKAFITSVNHRNNPSLRSFLNLGFFQGGSCIYTHGKAMVKIDEGATQYLKIK